MSADSHNTKAICEKLDRISDNLEDTNKILSSLSVIIISSHYYLLLTIHYWVGCAALALVHIVLGFFLAILCFPIYFLLQLLHIRTSFNNVL